MDVSEFLDATITCPEGYLCVALRSPNIVWHEDFFSWPDQRANAIDLMLDRKSEYDVYYSSYLFKERSSSKQNVLPSRTIQADLDGADIHTLPVQPSVITKTSPGRYQAYWTISGQPCDLELLELLSKRITYAIDNADKTGWSLGHKMRVANTLNHKYLEGPYEVEVVSHEPRLYSVTELELLPEVDSLTSERFDVAFIDAPPVAYHVGPHELLESIKPKIAAAIYSSYAVAQPDRSSALWALMCAGFRAGLDRSAVYWLALHSANNKFSRLKYNAERELAKDVLRAEHEVKSYRADARVAVQALRKSHQNIGDRKRVISDFVYAHMNEQGHFIKTGRENSWYIPQDTGKPVALAMHSSGLDSLLDIRYDLNRSEKEHEHATNTIINQMTAKASNGMEAVLSYYDPQINTLYVHSGRQDIYAISTQGTTVLKDGVRGIVFPWQRFLPFNPTPSTVNWGDALFGDLHNVTNLTPDQAKAVLKTWFMFMFFRNAAEARPILALFGSPGSGKTTLAHSMSAMLGLGNVITVTTATHFDTAVATRPVVFIDNVDTWEAWLPDRLAQSAGVVDMVRRKLYYDVETVVLERAALLALTAHDPKFTREDVTDRLVLLNMHRLEQFKPEQPIIDAIREQRNRLWYSVMQDLQTIIRTPMAETAPVSFRIADFARLGNWIAQGLGCADLFNQALSIIGESQITHNVETNEPLIEAIEAYIKHGGTKGEYIQATDIFSALELYCPTNLTPLFHRMYKNPVNLGKKLMTMMVSIQRVADIDWKPGIAGAKSWKITPRTETP